MGCPRAESTVSTGRSPHGERGLKYFARASFCLQYLSLPSRGAWIEIIRLRP